MKKILNIFVISFLLFPFNLNAEDVFGISASCDNPGSGNVLTIKRHNITQGTETILRNDISCTGVSSDSEVDIVKGLFYVKQGDGSINIYDYVNDTITTTSGYTGASRFVIPYSNSSVSDIITTGTDAEDNSTTTVLGSLDISDSNGNTLIEQDSTGTTIEIGEDSTGETGLIISNTSAALDIQDGSGNTMIKVTSDGATHIGENSLVTKEVNGRQELYATDATGNRININIPSGTNLLIDGEDVMGKIDSSVALGAAFSSLPTGAEGAGYTCGLGTGFHDSASAISGGCGFDFANYSFVDSMPELFHKASFNIGAASIVHGEGDDATLKAGITFKFGAPKPVREARDDNLLLENKIDAVMAKNETIQTENDLLKAQIAEINTQLKALNKLAMN
tara:strand:+ start:83 stop:1264 length:1182 start_codon:yes stop_codon:yes gene_type:complete